MSINWSSCHGGLPGPELPADVLELVFSIGRPGGESDEPLLDVKDRLRCQLVCKAWRHALDVRRWPLWRLDLDAVGDGKTPPAALSAAVWVQRVRPGVRHLHIKLCSRADLHNETEGSPTLGHLAARAVHGALLSLRPVELECLTATNFVWLMLEEDAAAAAAPAGAPASAAAPAAGGAAAAGGGAAPAPLLPSLVELHVSKVRLVALNVPLPSLAQLTIDGDVCRLAGEALHLPQLTSLQLRQRLSKRAASLRCSAMPALERAQLACCGHLLLSGDSEAGLQHLTRLDFAPSPASVQQGADLVAATAPSLRNLSLQVQPRDSDDDDEQLAYHSAQVLQGACAAPLTRLELYSPASLQHLSTWPHLQELVLRGLRPSNITAEQLALLAAAPSLRRLAFGLDTQCTDAEAAARMGDTASLQELQQALPGCAVELY